MKVDARARMLSGRTDNLMFLNSDNVENEMRCSHEVPYEVKCLHCYSEAMERERSRSDFVLEQTNALDGHERYVPTSHGGESHGVTRVARL